MQRGVPKPVGQAAAALAPALGGDAGPAGDKGPMPARAWSAWRSKRKMWMVE